MRRIDKSKIPSTDYKKWEKELESKNRIHPKYSANHRFYLDVIMSLYSCQDGLCAYTERRICEVKDYKVSCWNLHKFTGGKPKHYGELDHFDASLKVEKGWLWSNFFMVDGRVNRLKSEKSIGDILKPDLSSYDPFEIFEYDFETHMYIANTNKFDEKKQDEINEMIFELGLNYVVGPRSRYLNEKVQLIEDFGIETWDTIKIDEYPTAFAFIRAERSK
ncbi:hypothetical protein [Spirosoma rhododendri]|uniref:Uncharacterized protein n=1 Tax=Spirosoma rhododendri TaxID=2728024 RepID=A0A7L5DII7_9BACT|nr:hypothetical protein [Spirosoma rhododendri]QJD77212.1 hypothetical protein HH216_01325 [Spirosoma rhododendri]